MFALLAVASALLQTSSASDMDFWVGDWDCTVRMRQADGKWSETVATNHIDKTLGDKVVHENFKMGTHLGESWSVFNPKAKLWRQTWVDNGGGYIPLSGGKDGDRVILTTLTNPASPDARNRMIYGDIKKDSFTWRWESTTDGGKTWVLQWEVKYRRKG